MRHLLESQFAIVHDGEYVLGLRAVMGQVQIELYFVGKPCPPNDPL